MKIREVAPVDILGLNRLPPKEWLFDYEKFLENYHNDDFFHAFVLVDKEKIIGTGNVLLKARVGWLANIIITEEFRGRGLGYKMTDFLVNFLADMGCETMMLIATNLGKPVYEKIGFRKITDYLCFDSTLDQEITFSKAIRRISNSDLEQICELDALANGENRTHLIERYYKTGFGFFNKENVMLGFYLPDFGRGLVIARNKNAGLELLKLKHSEKRRRTLLPGDNKAGIEFLKHAGLKEGSQSSKMILGKENKWKPSFIYSYASGYCG